MLPQFFYFDMGNVLLRFSHERAAEQMARTAGIDKPRAWKILFEDGLHWQSERGEVTSDEFYTRFCEAAGVPLTDRPALELAANDIFELNVPIVGLLGHLYFTGHRLGVFSNTTADHWEYCTGRFGILTSLFKVHALSYRLRAMKPEPAAYAGAAALAGVAPEAIFFTDDRPENVAGARAAGWDAVPFESVVQLHEELRGRGLRVNY
jgi:putative hydrolase of the HAD superfamily